MLEEIHDLGALNGLAGVATKHPDEAMPIIQNGRDRRGRLDCGRLAANARRDRRRGEECRYLSSNPVARSRHVRHGSRPEGYL